MLKGSTVVRNSLKILTLCNFGIPGIVVCQNMTSHYICKKTVAMHLVKQIIIHSMQHYAQLKTNVTEYVYFGPITCNWYGWLFVTRKVPVKGSHIRIIKEG